MSSPSSLDTDNLELLILEALAENYATGTSDQSDDNTSNVIVKGLPAISSAAVDDLDSWVSTSRRFPSMHHD